MPNYRIAVPGLLNSGLNVLLRIKSLSKFGSVSVSCISAVLQFVLTGQRLADITSDCCHTRLDFGAND